MIQQRLEQKLVQKLSPQQIQLLKLLYLPVIQLEERIKEELEVNPALEEGSEDKDTFTTEEEPSEVASYDEEPIEDENVESEEDNEMQIQNTDEADDINLSYYYDDENENIDFYEPEAVHTPEDEKKPLPLVAKETLRQQLLEQLNA
ncbi:MAG: RNA polymerase sigma-54 factor, partial [Chitinophagales bacterium]|nr:RNA polymerase sigma-54 factor [Chitinophagales bacterium]